MFDVGQCIKVKTKTKDDVFGECVYRVDSVELFCPHCKGNDGIRFTMLGGSGPAAFSGRSILDCAKNIEANIQSGITGVIEPKQAKKLIEYYADGGPPNSPGGAKEVNW